MLKEIVLKMDEDDWDALNREFTRRLAGLGDGKGAILPDGTSNLPGAMVAEMVRDLEEYRSLHAKGPAAGGAAR